MSGVTRGCFLCLYLPGVSLAVSVTATLNYLTQSSMFESSASSRVNRAPTVALDGYAVSGSFRLSTSILILG